MSKIEGYRPHVCIADYTLKWFPKKYERYFLKGNAREKKIAQENVVTLHIFKESILLDDDCKFVNEELKISHLKRVLARYRFKYSEENVYLLRNVKVHSSSLANYSIDKD